MDFSLSLGEPYGLPHRIPPPATSRIKPKSIAVPQQMIPAIDIPFFASCVVTSATMLKKASLRCHP
jgi:hypothetical protein